MIASMSRKGNCYDNAPMESFWGLLKAELVHHCTYRCSLGNCGVYIEVFYNRQRIQAQLGYLSPAAFERKFYKTLFVA
ncbi:MAG: integrase catalytic subunit [Nitrospirae bacterium]|nr:MAG: integrase catalytic subunit [Nitrospirota bacterium]